ncbi:MAG: hypothetical protein ACOCV1_03955 [Bacillota bacterium]
MASKGVIYYNRGTKCMIRLLVSLHSLRKQWDGSVSIICSGEQQNWFIREIKNMDADIIDMPFYEGANSLALKSKLWRYSPYDLTMFLDADTIILNSIDEYFNYIDKYDFVTGKFSNWKTTGGIISSRIKAWKVIAPELIEPALNYGDAINTGVNGWKRGASLLPEWEELSKKGQEEKCTTRVLDEIACQILLPKHKHFLADTKWGESIKYGNYNDETIIIHYHGNKHAGDREANHVWKIMYNELINLKDIEEIKNNTWKDRSLKGYIKQIPTNLTIVTSVNNKYLNAFEKHFPMWMKTENLMELPYIIFAHQDCYDKICQFLAPYKNIKKIIKWEFPNASNMREEMLSSFVFGAAEHVDTEYWMKLDCDCTPIADKIEIPDEAFESVITAKKWHYTKVKSDESGENKHWLNRLDDWADSLDDFKGTERMFPENIEGRRYRHRRICSFCEIEKTNWTKHLANMCGNKLPVPSQDTTTWYAAKRLGKRKITEYNFKKYLKP